jgi:XTP/dITP diphosphohydrolase
MSRKGSEESSGAKHTPSRQELLFVSDNIHKYEEVRAVARELGFDVQLMPGLKLEVQSDSIEEVSRKSAILAYLLVGRPLLVEDAGLYIHALGGFPGPYSSFVYRTIGIEGVLKLLEGVSDRRACFKSVTTVIYEPFIVVGHGEVCGFITDRPRGSRGFGFDPIFTPDGSEKTFGEMSLEEKNRFSHRAKSVYSALSKLRKMMEQSG